MVVYILGELPACRPVQCGIPPNPTNGKSLFTAVAYKSVVVYECNYGFMISGNSTRYIFWIFFIQLCSNFFKDWWRGL